MRPLRFIALNEDGTHLVLAPDVPEAIDNGDRFLLPVDERLRAAARGDMSRLGQIEIELESSLRPRDIQARIRAGETPEQVAAVAGIRVEKVLRYAFPVQQERERIAEQARTARVRLADGTPVNTLDELMIEKLSLLDCDHRLASWDARKPGDGGWEVLVSWSSGNRRGATRWWYDVAARSVTPADAETSAFAEGSRAGQSLLAAAPVPATDDDELRPLAAVTSLPPAYSIVAEPPGTTAAQEPDDDPDGREQKARIPSWEDIVFGVRRKRP